MSRWIEPEPVNVPAVLRAAVGGHPLVSDTMVRRGITTVAAARAFLDPLSWIPASPEDLPGLTKASERVQQAVKLGQHIAIWGDFDVDGQTAAALLFECLRGLGARVTYRVPTRGQGHGFHRPVVDELRASGANLVITCDTGISAHEAIAYARASGMDVLVTDHHVPGTTLPPALAVVNPHLVPDEHPFAHLSGVGVAYQLARAMAPAAAGRALDLVALGTVADVASLVAENRYLVQSGLELLRRPTRPGLAAICQAAGLVAEGITEEHIGFVLGPRLNALGRLADANHGVELLVSDDWARVRMLAVEMEGLNTKRQWLTRQVTEAVLAQLDRDPSLLATSVLVASHPRWPEGILGIVAGRLADRLLKPVVLVAAPEGEVARGSGRSIPGIDLVGALTGCAHLLTNYGGHAGAAGFTIHEDRIPELRKALARAIQDQTEKLPELCLELDAYLTLPDLDLQLVNDIGRLAPFGRGNPPLALALCDLELHGDSSIGRTREHRRLVITDSEGRSQTVFWWQGADQPVPQGRFDLAVTLRTSNFRGVSEVQVEWLDARPREPDRIDIPTPQIKVRDFRTAATMGQLSALATDGEVAIWAEVIKPPIEGSGNRHELTACSRLAIWTLPPGPQVIQETLSRVKPDIVYFFGLDPGMDDLAPFLQRLAGLVKHQFNQGLEVANLARLAAATAQRTQCVEAGLELLAAQGQIMLGGRAGTDWDISLGRGLADDDLLDAARARLVGLLRETAAYRAYAASAPASSVISSHLLSGDRYQP